MPDSGRVTQLIIAGWIVIFFFVPIVTIIVVCGLYDMAKEKMEGWHGF